MRRGLTLVVSAIAPLVVSLAGCKGQGMKQVPAIPKDSLLASLPNPWNEYRERPPDEMNGYVAFRMLLTKDQGAVPSVPEGAENFSGQQKDALVNKYRPWIQELESSLAKDYWVAPLPQFGVASLFTEQALFKSIQKGVLFTANRALEQGERERAIHYLLLSDWFGDAQTNAGGSIIHMLVGLALDSMSFKSIVVALSDKSLTREDLDLLLSAAGRQKSEVILRNAALDEVQGMFVDEVAELRFPDAITARFFGESVSDDAIVKWEKAMHRIFNGHPDPLDKAATVQIVVEWWNLLLAAANEPFEVGIDLDKQVDDAISPWRIRNVGDMVELGALSEMEIERLATTARKAPNLYGRLFAGLFVSDLDQLYAALFKHQARGQILKAAIGVRIYEVKSGRLPESLQVVVDAGILRELPLDPFSGQGIRYNRAQRCVWSAGFDGKDDGGKSDSGKDSPDIVVKI